MATRPRYTTPQIVLASLAAALAAGETVGAIVAILMWLSRVREPAVRRLARDLPQAFAVQRISAIQADPVAATVEQNIRRRAAYLVVAAERVSRAMDSGADLGAAIDAERRYLEMHQRASARRMEVAAQVEFARRTSPSGLVGWQAVLDERTSRECRLAHGRNFDPRRIPPIGYPGSVHPFCRCRATAPFVTSKRVETIAPDPTRVAA